MVANGTTLSKIELSWDQVFSGNLSETPARQVWRDVVAEVTEKARAALPECNGRVEKAVALVLNGDVELLDGGKARVASQSNGATVYHVVNGECPCKDFPKAPQGFCKHRIAYGIHKRATALAKEELAQIDGQAMGNGQHTAESPTAEAPMPALPEAPASCNVYVTLAGRKVQVTLRDQDEQRMLARLAALLTRFPAETEAAQEPPEGWCSKHTVQMTQYHNQKGAWWSHKTADGWCRGK